MGLAASLGKFASIFTRRAQQSPPTPAGREIVMPASDDLSMEGESTELPGILGRSDSESASEGTTFAIEYRDSKNNRSTRRVTVLRLQETVAAERTMRCYCHERKAQRTFRLDRVVEVIDMDGEIHNPAQFFSSVFGIDFNAAEKRDDLKAAKRKREQHLKWVVSPDVQILAAVAHADGTLCDAECDAIVRHAKRRAHEYGAELLATDDAFLAAHVRRLRPTADSILRRLDELISCEPERFPGIMSSAVEVAKADGQMDDDERRVIIDAVREVTGLEPDLN